MPRPAADQNAQSGGFLGGGGLGGELASGLSGALAGGGLAGGLGGLLDQFKNAGHGEAVNSWVGGGQNVQLQPEQISQALGQQTISDLAQKAGVSEQDLLNILAQHLPGVIDKLTPNGQVPSMRPNKSFLINIKCVVGPDTIL